ncbi:response regulator receiver domain-containing protein [Gillisia sp. Hel_I_86]|uniref:response regulator transcription factor n=1 Tax=Gillisia sp. Hel_I_86 TaxID=1249981 RepID=UPI00119B3FDB|nr:response regulator transcription factor [Gillisia sp. Hel_I_86]TVZ27698.1 response regulator receiver domain-containing protein [Gillisia sp. Hel_I_86]
MKKILVIEDNPMVIKSLQFKLTKDGHDVVIANDGREAMKHLKEDIFDLILTDLMLPFVTGNELISYIKKNTPDTPIIVLSTSTQENIIMDAFNMGVDDFITKPFSPNELSLRVKRLLGKK